MLKKKRTKETIESIVNFIYESGMLSKTPRSGLWYLGTGKQSVAEHITRTALIAYALSYLTPEADKGKVVLMCLMHDLGEGRTSDLSYVHQKYGRLKETEAVDDLSKSVPFGEEIKGLYKEYKARETLEAKIVKDADYLEWLATLREEEIKGNKKAKAWASIAFKRLKTPIGIKIGKQILATHPDDWFFNVMVQVHKKKTNGS
jgi:putative hydrolase of HD superfamily